MGEENADRRAMDQTLNLLTTYGERKKAIYRVCHNLQLCLLLSNPCLALTVKDEVPFSTRNKNGSQGFRWLLRG